MRLSSHLLASSLCIVAVATLPAAAETSSLGLRPSAATTDPWAARAPIAADDGLDDAAGVPRRRSGRGPRESATDLDLATLPVPLSLSPVTERILIGLPSGPFMPFSEWSRLPPTAIVAPGIRVDRPSDRMLISVANLSETWADDTRFRARLFPSLSGAPYGVGPLGAGARAAEPGSSPRTRPSATVLPLVIAPLALAVVTVGSFRRRRRT